MMVRNRDDARHDYCAVVFRRQRAERLVDRYWLTRVDRPAGADDEQVFRVDHVAHDPFGDPAQRGVGQRTLSAEDARARQ